MSNGRIPNVEVKNISKYFGSVIALKDVSMSVYAGEVMCLLGDNGAGKSTLIKTLAGVHQQSEGQYLVEGEEVLFDSPRDALARGIATVYQDLAMIPLMSVSRNFCLGSEPTQGWGPFKRYNTKFAARVAKQEMSKMGIDIRDPSQPVGTLSGGERQSVAIARAVYFGAKTLILDEPTAALGVKQAGTVLRYVAQARARNLAVVFITHNPHHAYAVGDRFTILKRGQTFGTFTREELSREEMVRMMSGADELDAISHELKEFEHTDALEAVGRLSEIDHQLAEALQESEESSKGGK